MTLLYSVYGAVSGRKYDKRMRILSSSLRGLLHLQILLGLALVFSGAILSDPDRPHLHDALRAAAAQVPVSVMRRRPEGERTYPPHGAWALAALAMVVLGVMRSDGR